MTDSRHGWGEVLLSDGFHRVLLLVCAVLGLIVLIYQLGLPRGWWG